MSKKKKPEAKPGKSTNHVRPKAERPPVKKTDDNGRPVQAWENGIGFATSKQ